jgi:hypothetical protein
MKSGLEGERDQVGDGWGPWKRIFINTNFDSWLEKYLE